MKRFAFLFLLLASAAAGAQTDNTVYVKKFMVPNGTVGQAATAAQNSCTAGLTCIVIFDPSLANYLQGTLPTRCALCVWLDYRTPSSSTAGPSTGSYNLPSNSSAWATASILDGTSTNVWAGNGAGYSALLEALTVPVSATNWQNNALAGIIVSNSTSSSINAVGVYGQAIGTASGSNLWGANFIVDDAAGMHENLMIGNEIDMGINGSPTAVTGLQINGNSLPGTVMPVYSNYIDLQPIGNGKEFTYGLNVEDGAVSQSALVAGAVGTTASSASTRVTFDYFNGSDVKGQTWFYADPTNGTIYLAGSNLGSGLSVQNTVNAVGGFLANGTAGVSKTCTVLPTVIGGIVTSC